VKARQWWGELQRKELGEDKLKQFDTEELAWQSERNAGKPRQEKKFLVGCERKTSLQE